MKKNEIIDKFKSIGFREYEAKIFLVLLKGYAMSASEIAKEAKLVRTSIYDSLKSFVEKGYCNEIETSSILKYKIINPEVLIDKIQHDINEANTRKLSSLKETFVLAQEFCSYGKNTNPGTDDNNIELIRGFNKHRVSKYTELVNNANKEILGMNRIRGIVTDELNSAAVRLIKSGGEVRFIYKASIDFKIKKGEKLINATKEDLIRLIEYFATKGEKVRLTNMDIPNAAIFDSTTVIINITNNNKNARNKQSDIIIKNSDFVANMKDMFEYYWNNSMTIEEYKSTK